MSFTPRQTVLNVLGLITTPNEFGVYPEGACWKAENVLARAPNKWTTARNVTLFRQVGAGEPIYRLAPLADGRYLAICVNSDYVNGWELRVDGNTATPLVFGFPFDPDGLFDGNGYLEPTIARSRLFLNSRQGVVVLDNIDPSTATDRTVRIGGMGRPIIYGVTPVAGGPIPENVVCGYAVVVRRKTADGYVLTSPPSTTFRCRSRNAAGEAFRFIMRWPYNRDMQEGDEVQLYRTAGLLAGGTDVPDPGTSARLVASVVLSATDVSNTFVEITDLQPCESPLYESSGEEIYTSPYSEGGAGANLQPPVARALAQWGDYTFYGNVTDDPEWVMDVPAGVINTQNAAADTDFARTYGVGTRTFTGTKTLGSPTITGIAAADLLGIVPGQSWDGNFAGFPSSATVVSVGATSITMSANATVSGAALGGVQDVLEINGDIVDVIDLYYLAKTLEFGSAETSAGALSAYPSETIIASDTTPTPQYQVGVTLLVRAAHSGLLPEITVRGTNGQNYSPPIPEIDETPKTFGRTERPNVFRWSKQNQPEAVPTGNTGYAGGGDIIRMLSTTDQLWLLCTDGLRRLTGAAGQWRVDMVDPSVVPIEPGAACVMFDTLYVYTARGVVAVTGTEKRSLTRGLVDDLFPGRPFAPGARITLVANTTDEEILVLDRGAAWGGSGPVYVYSTLYQRWSTLAFPEYQALACGAIFAPSDGTPAYPIFGAKYAFSATITDVVKWRPTAGAPMTGILRFQPWYAGDPMLQKQWIDLTAMCEQGNAQPQVTLYCNNEVQTTGVVSAFNRFDNRVTFGIPRNYAINQILQPGLNFNPNSSSEPAVLTGLSVRLVPLTNQPTGKL